MYRRDLLWVMAHFQALLPWTPNKVIGKTKEVIQDWRGRSVQLTDFPPLVFEIEVDMPAVEGLLLHLLEDQNKVKVKGLSAFFSLCLVKEFIKASQYTNRDKSTFDFIGYLVVAKVRKKITVSSSTSLEISFFILLYIAKFY